MLVGVSRHPEQASAADQGSETTGPEPLANPLAGNPLRTRDDVADALRATYEPLVAHVSPGGARVRLGSFAAQFPRVSAELEGFARPLWGLAALAAGGGHFAHWDRIRDGLAAGTDPAHPEYWGAASNTDQRLVEMAAIGTGLLLAPGELWEPLAPEHRQQLASWLGRVDSVRLHENNWQFFRVLVDLGLARVGLGYDQRAHKLALRLIDGCSLGNGWYGDGITDGRVDWYGAFAFHTYGLLYAASGLGDEAQAERFRERAAAFAAQHRHWFAPDGAALAFGRSMTYRFAQAAFWGALALADVEALPWGELKGLYLRNLRYWSRWPISERDGVLSVGYGYENRLLGERYVSPGSPYWATKAFLALAVGPEHPFWGSGEVAHQRPPAVVVQPVPGMVLSHDEEQVVAVSARAQPPAFVDQAAAKYTRMAYSSRFGYCADVPDTGGRSPVSDATLTLTDGTGARRLRGESSQFEVAGELLACRWQPWPDVVVETVLWAGAPWHARAHRINTGRTLTAHEWGFALGFEPSGGRSSGVHDAGVGHEAESGDGWAVTTSVYGRAGVLDIAGRSTGEVRTPPPNVGLLWPRVAVPVLEHHLEPGEHTLVCLVFGSGPLGIHGWDEPPDEPVGLGALLRRRAGPAAGSAVAASRGAKPPKRGQAAAATRRHGRSEALGQQDPGLARPMTSPR